MQGFVEDPYKTNVQVSLFVSGSEVIDVCAVSYVEASSVGISDYVVIAVPERSTDHDLFAWCIGLCFSWCKLCL